MPLNSVMLITLSCLFFSFLVPTAAHSFLSDSEIAVFQKEIADKPIGERIALWAERFVGAPYDPNPKGEYVTRNAIVFDERVDCMYLSFRTVELSLSLTPQDALRIALDKRFINRGLLGDDGRVLNYEDRFQYGEDMLDSGKWGREITEEIGTTTEIRGSRGRDKVKIISKEAILNCSNGLNGSNCFSKLKNGDIIFFIKAPEKRVVGEIVGHIGIIKIQVTSYKLQVTSENKENSEIYLIHAGGVKSKGGEVKKVRLYDYIHSMPFIGVRVSRFN
ncbi:MAG: hypothetical protein HY755_07310 [Nitrospirae bacterium]|nr:hypothetical protein [Nitrospirota bacterium]